MADSTLEINKAVSRHRLMQGSPGVALYQIALGNAGLVILVMHEDVIPGLVFLRMTPRTPVVPGSDFHNNRINAHDHTTAVEPAVIDTLSYDEFSPFPNENP
jgi:hypothetical protein